MSFESATRVQRLSDDRYAVHLHDDWCIGSVPNGGYSTSVLLAAVRAHFGGTLARLNQPDTMTVQLQFVRRTSAGPAVVEIRPIKLGRGVSVLHVTLSQHGREELIGFVTQTNFGTSEGLTLGTHFTESSALSPSPPPPIDFARVLRDAGDGSGGSGDGNWLWDQVPPSSGFRRATKHLVFCHPREPDSYSHPSIVDQWVRFRPGGPGHPMVPFPQDSLGFVVDMFPVLVERFPGQSAGENGLRWYPTVALNMDIKRRLEEGKSDWLFVRVQSTEIRDGRMDLQVLVLDQEGRLVALSSHVTMVLSAARNTAPRKEDGSKL